MASTSSFVFFVKTFHSSTVEISAEPSDTVMSIKEKLQVSLNVPSEQQRLIHSCKELGNDVTVAEAGLQANAVVFLVLKLQGVQKITVRTLDDKEIILDALVEDCIQDVKARIEEKTGTAVHRQRLIANGKEPEDTDRLVDHFAEQLPGTPLVLHLLVRNASQAKPEGEVRSNSASMRALKEKLENRLSKKRAVWGADVPPEEQSLVQQAHPTCIHGPPPSASSSQHTTPSASNVPAFGVSQLEEIFDSVAQDEAFADLLGDTSPLVDLPSMHPAMNQVEFTASLCDDAMELVQAPAPVSVAPAKAAPVRVKVEKKTGKEVKVVQPGVRRSAKQDENAVDDRLRKRLLKNRLSAERSRQRKQAYMEELEYKLSLSKSENAQLRERVRELEMSLAAVAIGNPAINTTLQPLRGLASAH